MLPEDRVYDAWLAMAEMPYEWLIPLLYELKSSRNVYHELMEEHKSLRGLIPDKCRSILEAESGDKKLDEIQQLMEHSEIRTLTILDEAYPHCLREIADPPGILFYQGDVSCLKHTKTIAMVGSRAASYAGMKAARKIARDLSRNGVMIISGLAYGIDSECHEGCLEGGSPTIGVMGCGLDRNYPTGNESLKRGILAHGGLIISEYAPGSNPIGRHFPYRNRIISGLSRAVVLMEAKIRSGSMTTIGHALKQGREVYAYPGDPDSPKTEANRILLREGARFFTEASDILTDLNWLDNMPLVRQNSGCHTQAVPDNGFEATVFRALTRGVLGFDELLKATGLSSPDLMSTLTVLQIKKMIDPLPGKKYQLRQS